MVRSAVEGAYRACRRCCQGAEAREIFLGKLFGLGAIARSLHVAGSGAHDATVLARLVQETAALSRKKGVQALDC